MRSTQNILNAAREVIAQDPLSLVNNCNFKDINNERISKNLISKNKELEGKNHAVRFYELPSNPAAQVGNMGRENTKEMLFWTKEEYTQFSIRQERLPADSHLLSRICRTFPYAQSLEDSLENISFQRMRIMLESTPITRK